MSFFNVLLIGVFALSATHSSAGELSCSPGQALVLINKLTPQNLEGKSPLDLRKPNGQLIAEKYFLGDLNSKENSVLWNDPMVFPGDSYIACVEFGYRAIKVVKSQRK